MGASGGSGGMVGGRAQSEEGRGGEGGEERVEKERKEEGREGGGGVCVTILMCRCSCFAVRVDCLLVAAHRHVSVWLNRPLVAVPLTLVAICAWPRYRRAA